MFAGEEDIDHDQAILSQACWDYEEVQLQATPGKRASTSHRGRHERPATAAASLPPSLPASPTMTLRDCLREADGAVVDILVLVLHSSGLRSLITRAKRQAKVTTVLLRDVDTPNLKLSVWGEHAAIHAARLLCPGDVVRINGVRMQTYRGRREAFTTWTASFAVVWRDYTFLQPGEDSMWIPSKRQPPDGLLVARAAAKLAVEAAAARALVDFTMEHYASLVGVVASAAPMPGEVGEGGGDDDDGVSVDGSIWKVAGRHCELSKAVAGVPMDAIVRCLSMSAPEMDVFANRSRGGPPVLHATVVVADAAGGECCVQLWGDLAASPVLRMLSVAAEARAADAFELTRLLPSYSFVVGGIVLNTTAETSVEPLPRDHPQAVALRQAAGGGGTAFGKDSARRETLKSLLCEPLRGVVSVGPVVLRALHAPALAAAACKHDVAAAAAHLVCTQGQHTESRGGAGVVGIEGTREDSGCVFRPLVGEFVDATGHGIKRPAALRAWLSGDLVADLLCGLPPQLFSAAPGAAAASGRVAAATSVALDLLEPLLLNPGSDSDDDSGGGGAWPSERPSVYRNAADALKRRRLRVRDDDSDGSGDSHCASSPEGGGATAADCPADMARGTDTSELAGQLLFEEMTLHCSAVVDENDRVLAGSRRFQVLHLKG